MGSAHCPSVGLIRSLDSFFSVTWCGGGPTRTRPWSPRTGLCIDRAGPAGATGWWGSQHRLPSGRRRWSTEEAPSVFRPSSRPPHLLPRRVQRSLTEPRQQWLHGNTRQTVTEWEKLNDICRCLYIYGRDLKHLAGTEQHCWNNFSIEVKWVELFHTSVVQGFLFGFHQPFQELQQPHCHKPASSFCLHQLGVFI